MSIDKDEFEAYMLSQQKEFMTGLELLDAGIKLLVIDNSVLKATAANKITTISDLRACLDLLELVQNKIIVLDKLLCALLWTRTVNCGCLYSKET
jgi:hypothetical protein